MTAPAGPRLAVYDALGRRVVPIDKLLFTIGRGDGCDLQLGGAEVSRDHAEIATTADGYVLRDRQSRHGVFVNGARVSQRLLVGGDRIECGGAGAVLLFLLGEAPAQDADGPAVSPGDLRQVAVLLDALREMGTDRVLEEVLVLVLDSAIESTGAERGLIMLVDDAGALEPTVARGAGRVSLAVGRFPMSRKIPEAVFATGRITVVSDLLEDGLAAAHTGTVALGIRHVLCAPLRLVRYVERAQGSSGRENIGVLYLDSRERGRILASSARTALEALATEAAGAIENARLYQQALEKARLDEELRMASRIQQTLLPESRRAGPFFQAVGASRPSRAIGGDFYEYQTLADGRFGFGLGDVTGKGPPAALLTALAQGVLAAEAATGSWPGGVVALINRILLSRPIESRFLTLFLGALAPDGTLTYCNAGQNPPLLFSGGDVQRLETGGTLLGAFPEVAYGEAVLRLSPGDTLVLFSDGMTEALSPTGEEFGEARVRAVVAARRGEEPGVILDALMAAVTTFARGADQHDDLTAVVLRFGSEPPVQ